MENRAELEAELLHWFAAGVDAPTDEERFRRLALRVFRYQFARNKPYQAFCLRRNVTPDRVMQWEAIPGMPTNGFKAADLTTVAPDEVRVVYQTSGTSRGDTVRGRHLLPDVRLYDASLLPNVRAHVLPDRDSIRVLAAGPTDRFFPHSSLGHMYGRILDRFGTSGSGIFWRADGPRFPCLASALAKAEREKEPVLLLGTAFGFVLLLDWLAAEGKRFTLPPGSRLVDTGGYKGRSREVPREELYSLYTERLGIPNTHLVNEYGMTELGSQFYDTNLKELAAGLPIRPRAKSVPPWVRVQVVDPETLQPWETPGEGWGRVGLLRIVDLANLHSVIAIQTDDLGQASGSRFQILGRAGGAEARGCSLAAEELLEQTDSRIARRLAPRG